MITKQKHAELTNLVMYICLRCNGEFYTQGIIHQSLTETYCPVCGTQGCHVRTD